MLLKGKRTLVVWAAAIATTFTACSGGQIDTVRVESPSGRVRITATVGDGGVSYSVERAGVAVIAPSPLEIRLQRVGGLAANATVLSVSDTTVDESGALPWGKVARVRNHYRAATIHLRSRSGARWDLELRAYDDGVALRY